MSETFADRLVQQDTEASEADLSPGNLREIHTIVSRELGLCTNENHELIAHDLSLRINRWRLEWGGKKSEHDVKDTPPNGAWVAVYMVIPKPKGGLWRGWTAMEWKEDRIFAPGVEKWVLLGPPSVTEEGKKA